MGFWHTGYMEFHEEVGIRGYEFRPNTREYPCTGCARVFATAEELQKHRLEQHPLHRPALIVRGEEMGSRRMIITSKIEPTDIVLERCERVLVDEKEIPVEKLGEDLAARSWGTCRLVLCGAEAPAEFKVEFRIASEEDLTGVEGEFARVARTKLLDGRTVEDLITATRQFTTAKDYSDAICTYLQGVLVKERTCSLPYARYNAKYTESVENLNWYDRPLARAIVSVIEFHHNHFDEAALKGQSSRTGEAARKFQRWLHARGEDVTNSEQGSSFGSGLDCWVSDRETEEIVHWTLQPKEGLVHEAERMEAFLGRDVAELDRVKVRILLAEMYWELGERSRASEHAKSVGSRTFEEWARTRILPGAGQPE